MDIAIRNSSRLFSLFLVTLLFGGCSVPMVSLYYVDDSQVIKKTLEYEQIKQSIIEGADYAGWETQDLGDNNILATYLANAKQAS